MFSFQHITTHNIELLVVLLAAMYVYIFNVVDSPFYKARGWDKWYQKCLAPCHSDVCTKVTTTLRDSNYYLDGDNKSTAHVDCAFTLWELSHILFHVYLGYTFNFAVSFAISALFELVEHVWFNCGSVLDLGHNATGGLLGVLLRHLLA